MVEDSALLHRISCLLADHSTCNACKARNACSIGRSNVCSIGRSGAGQEGICHDQAGGWHHRKTEGKQAALFCNGAQMTSSAPVNGINGSSSPFCKAQALLHGCMHACTACAIDASAWQTEHHAWLYVLMQCLALGAEAAVSVRQARHVGAGGGTSRDLRTMMEPGDAVPVVVHVDKQNEGPGAITLSVTDSHARERKPPGRGCWANLAAARRAPLGWERRCWQHRPVQTYQAGTCCCCCLRCIFRC